jgi:putative spermidine/putrescine transport system permease protein
MSTARKVWEGVVPYFLLLPAAILLFFFLYGLGNGILQGFGYLPYLSMTDLTLDYYIAAFTRPDLASSIQYSLYLAVVTCLVSTVLGVFLCAMLCRIKAGRLLQMFAIRIPMCTSTLVVCLMIMTFFVPTGLFPRLLYSVGLIDSFDVWPGVMGNVNGYGVILVYAWREVAFVAYFTISIMSHIDGTFTEAATTLGASPLKVFFTITLPLCRTTILRAALIVFAVAFGGYEVALLFSPTSIKALPVLAYIEYSKVDLSTRAYAMALSGVAALFSFALSIIYYLISRKERKVRGQ